MADKYEIISKREYTDHTPVGFVGIKQYTLIKRADKRFIIIRFSNDLGARIDRLFFTLEQIDANGRAIELSESEYTVRVGLDAGISFEKELAVDEKCVAVTVQINKVSSCGKEYCLENGKIAIVTDTDAVKNDISPQSLIKPSKKKGIYWKLILISVAAIIIILGINLLFAILQR